MMNMLESVLCSKNVVSVHSLFNKNFITYKFPIEVENLTKRPLLKDFCISFKKSAKINSFSAGFEIQQNFGTPAAKATIFLYKWNLVQKKNLAPLSFLQFYCCASLKAIKISGLF